MKRLLSRKPKHHPLRDCLQVIGAVVVGALLLKIFVLDAVYIPSRSMERTLLPGDFVIVSKLVNGTGTSSHSPFAQAGFPFFTLPSLKQIGRGDVVVFEFPEDYESNQKSLYFVKRCVALSGDVVRIDDGKLFINGELVNHYRAHESDFGPIRIPKKGDIIALSDQTYAEWSDIIRREGHTIEQFSSAGFLIDGKPATHYRVEKDYFFVLGDNLNESYDSRSWGFLPVENVVGKAIIVYWSMDPSSRHGVVDRLSSIRWNRIGTLISQQESFRQ